jgi:hypothetical protein
MFMTRKTISIIGAIVLLVALSLYLNRDRFKSDHLQIGDRTLQPRGQGRRGPRIPTNAVVFLLNRETQLTSVRVVFASEIATNKYATAIWELVSDSNSVPVKDFVYGMNIRGMKPLVPNAVPDSLQPGVKYRLLVEAADKEKAEHEFSPTKQNP